MKSKKIAAIIIAAGYSSRMDGFKPLLEFESETALEKVVKAHQQAGIEEIIVVLGYRAEVLMPYVKKAAITAVINENYDQGMYTSIIKGISQLSEDVDGFFIHPVDIPLVKTQSLKKLRDFFEKTDKGIVYPCFFDKRGHPPLIDSRYKNVIIDNKEDGGLKKLLGNYQNDAINLPLADEAILMDMDTRLDYQKLLVYSSRKAPNLRECEALLDIFQVSEQIRKHSRAVRDVALALAGLLIEQGISIDSASLEAAALLHDICRSEKNHPEKGAMVLTDLGYPKIGNLILTHMDITVNDEQPITESEILYLSDKMVKEDQPMPLNCRKSEVLKVHQEQPEILKKINNRYQNAEMIAQKIETISGKG
ncbi:DVU_1551 family NTP transferase [Acetobacterium woodii]|uniref:Putative metal dependent phosphohydrolase, MobA-like protein n=1 Tax=Acetobacterium woodii (strain ATCC 29683 / DSM 1030 / JCM 2381 / KCTC 1655 / WB1) TaxID=931626 RepID=H6LFH7_ACEWD|nr:NTP transferase domain-containing protein [Acetobacterium woodii]AFA49464.1 putative metal dependent phosphohydrolase, MobA-like protein [Acetobacterium woodii DSM 1030]